MKIAFAYINGSRFVGRGVGYVAGSMIRAGHSVTFFDTFYQSVREVAWRVCRGDFDVLMISSMSTLFPQALDLIGRVKRQADIPILMGGTHATAVGGEILEKHAEIDYICIGEGESMVLDFLDHLGGESLYRVRNLGYRRNGKVVINPVRPAEDLASVAPFPWYLFHKRSLISPAGITFAHATRGCPYNCSYCCNGVYLKHYGKGYLRLRPVQEVVDELVYLRDLCRPHMFHFGDEMILWDKDYAAELFRAVRRQVAVPYGCMIRVEHVTDKVAKLLQETNCRYVAMGVECGDEAFRREWLNRHMSNKQIEHAFALLKNAGMLVSSFNMIGYPFEHDDALTEATVRLNRRLAPDLVQVSVFYPLPGAKLYDYCRENNLIDQRKASRTVMYVKRSVLKGKSLVRRRLAIDRMLNPENFNRKLQRILSETYKETYQRRAAGDIKRPARRILVISGDNDEIDPAVYDRARRLAEAGNQVTLVSGFRCRDEEHYFRGKVKIHRYALQHRKKGLRRFLAELKHPRRYYLRLLEHGVRTYFAENRFAAVVERLLERFPADVVVAQEATLLKVVDKVAARWGAEFVRRVYDVRLDRVPGSQLAAFTGDTPPGKSRPALSTTTLCSPRRHGEHGA